MKPITLICRLRGSSVLVSFAMLGISCDEATAGERIDVRIEGIVEQWAVAARQDVDTGDGSDIGTSLFDQKHNSEIGFVGEAELENGLTVGMAIDVEANSEDNQIDELYIYLELSPAGLIQVGNVDNAPITMHVGAPDGGISVNDGDLVGIEAFVLAGGFEEANTLIDTTVLQLGDDTSGKISYFTPELAGFGAGVSFSSRTGARTTTQFRASKTMDR